MFKSLRDLRLAHFEFDQDYIEHLFDPLFKN